MPHGYIDPIQRVREQQALRNTGRPNFGQPQQCPVQLPQVQSPLAGPEYAQQEIISSSGLGQPRYRSRESAVATAALGALVGVLIYRNWHRGWVRAVTTWTGTFLGTSIAGTIAAGVISAYVKPGDQADLGPIVLWSAVFALAVATLATVAAVRLYRPGATCRS